MYFLEKPPYSLSALASRANAQYAVSTNENPRVLNNRLEIMKLQLQDCAEGWNRQYADSAIFSCNNYSEQPEGVLSRETPSRHKNPQVYGTMFRSAARAATAITERSNSTTPRSPITQIDKKNTLADSGKPLLDFPDSPGEGVTTAKEVGSWLSFAVLGLGVML